MDFGWCCKLANRIRSCRLFSRAGSVISVTANPFTVTGLNPTSYDFYVRDSCAAGSVEWTALTASTACAAIVAPYTEFQLRCLGNRTGATNENDLIDPCWTRNQMAIHRVYRRLSGTGSGGTLQQAGPATGNGGSGNYVYSEASASTMVQGPICPFDRSVGFVSRIGILVPYVRWRH